MVAVDDSTAASLATAEHMFIDVVVLASACC